MRVRAAAKEDWQPGSTTRASSAVACASFETEREVIYSATRRPSGGLGSRPESCEVTSEDQGSLKPPREQGSHMREHRLDAAEARNQSVSNMKRFLIDSCRNQ